MMCADVLPLGLFFSCGQWGSLGRLTGGRGVMGFWRSIKTST